VSLALKKPPEFIESDFFSGPHLILPKSKSSIHYPKIRIAVSLDAIFDLSKEVLVRKEHGEKAIRKYMWEHKNSPFSKGAAFAFLSKLMDFNKTGKKLVSLTVISDLSKETSRRAQFSLTAHNLTANAPKKIIKDLYGDEASNVFTCEEDLKLFDLILSTNMLDVKTALSCGLSAGHVNPAWIPKEGNSPFHPVFDFDRCIAFASGEKESEFHIDEPTFSKETVKGPDDIEGLSKVRAREKSLMNVPAKPASVAPFFLKLCALREIVNKDPKLGNMLLSVVTARSAESFERAKKNIFAWAGKLDHIESSGWNSKGDILERIGATSFFDDGKNNVKDAQEKSPKTFSVHTPWQPKQIQCLAAPYGITCPL